MLLEVGVLARYIAICWIGGWEVTVVDWGVNEPSNACDYSGNCYV